MVGLKFLQCHSLFGGLSDEEMKHIRPLLQEEHFEAGQDIVREGDPGERLYFICSGSVEILKAPAPSGTSETEKLATLGRGDTFGEMELIDVQNYAATVRADKPTTVLTLSHADLYKIYKWNVKTYTMIILNLAREISRRLRQMDDLLASALYSGRHDEHEGKGGAQPEQKAERKES